MTAKQKVEALTTAANEVTGESATNLTDAVQDLVDGYGGGELPDSYILLSDYNSSGSPTKAEIYGVRKLLNYCFYHCTGLTSITIPSSVTSIGGNCFDGCIRLTSITIPSSVTSIGASCFYDCTGLTLITLERETVYNYPSNCLAGTNALQHIYVSADLVDSYKAASGWSAFADKIEAIPTT